MLDICTKRVQFLAYPTVCLLCGARGSRSLDLCEACQASLPTPRNPCRSCGDTLPVDGESLCGRCQRRPPRFDSIVVPFAYAHPVDWVIQRLKFQGRLAHGRLLGELLGRTVLIGEVARPDVLIPVPLHPSRLRERGFNQAAEIARHVARATGLRLDTGSVRRHKATEAQMGLPAKRRRRNVRGVFEVRVPERIAGRHIAVVDDVVTTGSTVEELARILKRAEAARVDVWTCARA